MHESFLRSSSPSFWSSFTFNVQKKGDDVKKLIGCDEGSALQ